MARDVPEAVHLSTPDEVDAFLESSPHAAVFKAGGCSQTDWALVPVRRCMADHPEVFFGFVSVLDAQAASRRVTERSGVRHESPQILIFRRGEVVFHREHSGISEASLSEAIVLLSSNGE
jgi:bacillithiol system protein YtxJ